jgi:alpha-L-fucosidase
MRNVITVLFLLLHFLTFGQEKQATDEKMQWFSDAKLGIFIHWGIYAVNGIDESWSFFNGYLSYEDYMQQKDAFTASKYDPEAWAEMIASSGAKYAVLTTKHHDGMALWPSKTEGWNVMEHTPAGRDLVGPLMRALEKRGVKKGVYFSLLDWSHPDYDRKTREEFRYKNDPKRFSRFVDFNFSQVKELSENYKPDLFWFDGDWEHSPEEWRSEALKAQILRQNPMAIINSRIGGGLGDYATPEQGVPISRPSSPYWELCLTTNENWGYQPTDTAFKTPSELLRIFVDCIKMGGNLLMNIAPREDGTFPEEIHSIMQEFGRWTKKHADAVYGVKAGIPDGHVYAATSLDPKENILYVYLDSKAKESLVIKGLKNKINRIWVLGNGAKLEHKVRGKQYWSDVPGLVYIDIPEEVYDPSITVLAILLDGPLQLYREQGRVIEDN